MLSDNANGVLGNRAPEGVDPGYEANAEDEDVDVQSSGCGSAGSLPVVLCAYLGSMAGGL